MSYDVVRDRIYSLLLSVPDIGNVYSSPRYASDWRTYLERFRTRINDRDVIRLCWFTRSQVMETAIKSEADHVVHVERSETWSITVIHGFEDVPPSEYGFQEVLDGIQDVFRYEDQLGIPEVVQGHSPVNVVSAGMSMFGDVLCHKAELSLKIDYH